MIRICIIHRNCIILRFYTSCHIKGNLLNFFFLFFFCSLVRNENTKKAGFVYVTSNKSFFKFSTAKTTKQKKTKKKRVNIVIFLNCNLLELEIRDSYKL